MIRPKVRGIFRETQYQRLGDAEYIEVVHDLQARHGRLLERLGELGTLGSRSFLEAIRPEQPPYEFVRDDVAEFLFPPQEDLEMYSVYGATANDDVDHPEVYVHENYTWDASQITTFLQVRYDDFHNPPYMGVNSIPADRPVPPEIQAVIDEAFDSQP
jgi:hypothetical protein